MACVFYRDLRGAWRWEMREGDGSVMESPYGYASRAECVAAAVKCGLPVDGLPVPAADEAHDARLASVLPRRSVLCVVSNPDAQNFLQDVLSEYRVVVASTGFEALRSLNHAVFDLYLLDYWLADWSGVSLCRDIRKLDPRGPVCFYATADRADEALGLAVVAERPARSLDAAGQRGLADEPSTPHGVEQFILGDEAVVVAHQLGHHVEHLGLDLDHLVTAPQLVAGGVQREVVEPPHLTWLGRWVRLGG